MMLTEGKYLSIFYLVENRLVRHWKMHGLIVRNIIRRTRGPAAAAIRVVNQGKTAGFP